MGAFVPAYPSLEALIENILALTAALAIYPAEFILTAADYLQNLSKRGSPAGSKTRKCAHWV